jgi:hypothetical protein
MTTTLLCIGVAVGLAICVHKEIRRRAAFRERFSPISDAEFLRRCPPDTNPDIALRVRRIVSDALAVEYERIYPSSRLMEDLGA